MCRLCCRDKCHTENVACLGHKFKAEGLKRKNPNDKTILTDCSNSSIDNTNVEPDG